MSLNLRPENGEPGNGVWEPVYSGYPQNNSELKHQRGIEIDDDEVSETLHTGSRVSVSAGKNTV